MPWLRNWTEAALFFDPAGKKEKSCQIVVALRRLPDLSWFSPSKDD